MADQTKEQIDIIDSSQLRVHVEPALSLAVLTFNGCARSDHYKTGVTAVLNLLKEEKLHRVLINCGSGCSIKDEDLDWTFEKVVPEIARGPDLKKVAIIESPNINSRISLMSLFEKLVMNTDIEIQFFEKEKNARSWISEDSNLDF
ncbi:hypothetical protein ABID22_000967 [Pontibacter aydingkolensis]|uniref:STAS/SEC14 domain-containing protein n=1 Tax=Pontibacter aydingkolensis TaxID=1911536 RepID=A0ABS7CSF3_9BACT|nr:STAS/SEC14 domain-containing protein [Pontibacter aydingkolensis]MBW7466781.1 STAS/SEC14 domain-containing protein [Pontibacter aydingkolensis]